MVNEKLQSMLMGMAFAELSIAPHSRSSDEVLGATIHDLSWTLLALRVAQVTTRHQDPVHCADQIWQTVQTFFARNTVPDDVLRYPIWAFPIGLLTLSNADMRSIATDLAIISGLDSDFALAMMLLAHGSQNDMPIAAMLNLLHTELSERYERNLLRVGHVLTWGSEQHALNHLRTPAGTGAVLAQSLYMLFRYAPDNAAIIQHSLRTKDAPGIVSMMTGWITGGLADNSSLEIWHSSRLFSSIQDELAAG